MKILNLFAFMALGFVTGLANITVSDWQFWAIMGCALVISITGHFSK